MPFLDPARFYLFQDLVPHGIAEAGADPAAIDELTQKNQAAISTPA